MALNSKNLKEITDNLKQINDLGNESAGIFKSIEAAIDKAAKKSNDLKAPIKEAAKAQANLVQSANELARFSSEDLKDRKKAKKFNDAGAKLAKDRLSIESKIRVLNGLKLNASNKEKKNIKITVENLQNSLDYVEGMEHAYNKISSANDELNSNTKWLDGLADTLKTLPGIGPLISEPFKKASKTMRDARVNNDKFFKASLKGAASLGESFGPAFLLGAIIKGGDHLVKMTRSLQMSTDEAHEFEESIENIAWYSGKAYLNQKNLQEAMQGLTDETGVAAHYSEDILTNQVFLTKQLGVSGKAAAKYAKYQTTTGKSAKETNEEIADAVTNLKKETGIAFKLNTIFEEVANVNAGLKAAYGFNNKLLAEQVVKTKQLGINMAQAEKIASSMLDFESSIQAELEAELLTGKSLNLEEARRLSLMGKSSEAAAEILNQVGSTEDLMKMNVIQQEALANAVGMERNELIASVKERETLAKIGGNSVKAQLEAAKTEEEREKIKKRIKEQGGEELLQQYEITSAAEKFQAVVIKMQKAFERIGGILEPFILGFSKLLDSAGGLYTILGLIATVALAGIIEKTKSILTTFGLIKSNKAKQLAMNQQEMAQQEVKNANEITNNALKTEGLATETATSGVSKTTLATEEGKVIMKKASNKQEKIGFGLSMKNFLLSGRDLVRSIGQAVMKAFTYLGPILGTIAAVGIGALGYSFMKDGVIGPGGETVVSGPKGSIQLDKEDSMIVGTDLGGKKKGNKPNNEKPPQPAMNDARLMAKLDQLIAATKSGKNITMAGDKVNTGIQNETYNQA
jgi:hypothetical protein